MAKDIIVNKNEEYSDGKYSVLNFTKDTSKFTRIVCNQESICLIPFDVNEHNQIKNIYLAKYHDYVTDAESHKCVTGSLKPDEFSTFHESLVNCIDDELGLTDVDVNDLFYLGTVKHGVPFNKSYKCYAVNVTNYSDDVSGFTPMITNPESRLHKIDKVRFNRLANGEINDSLALSGTLLLLSYLSE